jgi:hypothetical protein
VAGLATAVAMTLACVATALKEEGLRGMLHALSREQKEYPQTTV